MDMLWGEFRGGGRMCCFHATTREYFLEIKVKKKICILNIQYSIDRDNKKLEILSRFMYFLF